MLTDDAGWSIFYGDDSLQFDFLCGHCFGGVFSLAVFGLSCLVILASVREYF